MCTLREVFTKFKMKIPSKASTFMSEDRFDVRKGPNLKMQVSKFPSLFSFSGYITYNNMRCIIYSKNLLHMHLKGPYFAEMINQYGICIY